MTKYKNVLMFAQNRNCYIYDKPQYTIEVTLEENMRNAITALKKALSDNRKGVKNQEYLDYCKKNLKKAKKYIYESERL